MFGDIPGRMAAWADGNVAMSANPFADAVSSLDDEDFSLLEAAVAERRCREAVGAGTLEEAAELWRPDPPCPTCGFSPCALDGHTPARRQRLRCPVCGRRFSALTGTVFEYGKRELPAWERFVTCMVYNAPLDLAAAVCGISHQSAFEWRHRVFAATDGYQERLRLRDLVWIDELYLTDTEVVRSADFEPRRGLSRNKVCIALAIDVYRNVVAIACGHGKPSSKRISDALMPHIARESTVIHDMERAHAAMLKELGCKSIAYKADPKDERYLEAMAMVNNLCAWLRRYLSRFSGMRGKNLQSYLNWFVYLYRVKRDEEKWPKIARVLRHLAMTDANYRSSRKVPNPHAR